MSHGVPSPGNTTAPPVFSWIAIGRSERLPEAGTSKNARGANTYFGSGLLPASIARASSRSRLKRAASAASALDCAATPSAASAARSSARAA